jgi:quercetin dioxygenase-like cupin family protein
MAGGQVIDNPISGERIVIRQSGAETDGRLLAFDLFLPPGAHVPATHAHPVQEERFTVVAGQMRFQIGRRCTLVGPGQTLVVEPGTAHWFGNVGPDTAVAHVEIRPALRMEELLERSGAIGAGAASPAKLVPRLPDLALVLLEFERELAVPRIPAALLRLLLLPFAWLARHRGSARA